jgi:hypothetical protein
MHEVLFQTPFDLNQDKNVILCFLRHDFDQLNANQTKFSVFRTNLQILTDLLSMN